MVNRDIPKKIVVWDFTYHHILVARFSQAALGSTLQLDCHYLKFSLHNKYRLKRRLLNSNLSTF